MKVLFINTVDTRGGAAIVASRLSKVLSNNSHVECITLAAIKNGSDPRVHRLRGKAAEIIEIVIDKLSNWVGLQYQFFPFSSWAILAEIRQFKPDIISLHNTHGGYFSTRLLKKISMHAPVVWTLHDMWSFTGNSAHTFQDDSWQHMQNASHLTKIYPAIGINRGSALLRQKARVYQQSDITIITPSVWLFELAQKSPVFRNKQIIQVNNGIDLGLFHHHEKKNVRASLGIPNDARVLMFSAENLDSPWKGGKDLIETLKIINSIFDGKIHLIITGNVKDDWMDDLSNFVIHKTGYVDSEEMMARYFSASDLFLYPTRADNLPNVLIEAIACSTPCVTFNVGGCKEIILNGFNGIVVEPSHLREMAEAVVSLLNDDTSLRNYSAKARLHAEQNFSIEQMGKQYYDLFKSLVNQRLNKKP